MAAPINSKTVASSSSLDPLDRVVIGYLTFPLVVFLIGWFEVWAAVPLLACAAYALKPLAAALPVGGARLPLTPLQFAVAIAVGCAWTVCGGTGHFVFANADWHIRDAVLHDLVAGRWPVGYGVLGGKDTLLRAPIGYYVPAALVGKWGGLLAAHFAMAAWTAVGATLFLLQVLSLTPSRAGAALMAAAVVVLFSGFDIIGSLLDVPHFIAHWDITGHLEWWAGSYQYSSMTTQLFWVPHHALSGWLTMGLLCRDQRGTPLDSMLPIIIVAVAVWSPLTALGIVPFALYKGVATILRERSPRLLDPLVWAPALGVGLAVAAYLTLDAGRIPKGWTVGRSGLGAAGIALDLLHQAEFFILEAGFIGVAILAIRRSSQVVLALVILALLPLFSFGAANDLAMRASIPSLSVLAIGACLALSRDASNPGARRKKALLVCLLAVGAVTPLQEFARAVVLPAWPINMQATLIDAACGRYLENYVARLEGQPVLHILRPPHALSRGSSGPACENPALGLMRQRGLLQ
ncbi:MAG: hypothetical protein ACLP2F_07305 [Steroidobacteraceae bacterium]